MIESPAEPLTFESPDEFGSPLSPWVYTSAELFELEYDAFFLRRWQFVGHVSQIPEPGDYMSASIGRDSLFVIRGKDDMLRAFLNVCRHRGSRIVEGSGHCKGVIRCPYHGWTYQLDGGLLGVPKEDTFPDFDRSRYGLHEIQLEVYHGFAFVRVRGDGSAVGEWFGQVGRYFELFDAANHVPCLTETCQVWDVNWKIAWDNYLENYHIPVGHPGLNRLLIESEEAQELASGVSYGVFELRDKPSTVDIERRYQELCPTVQGSVPEDVRGKWVQIGVSGSLGIDLYAEAVDIFQLIPLSHEKTLVRAAYFGRSDPSDEERELRQLLFEINDNVNDEDKTLCERVQKGLQTTGYRPGPLSSEESSVWYFHEMVRRLVPVARLDASPPVGQVAIENSRMLQSSP